MCHSTQTRCHKSHWCMCVFGIRYRRRRNPLGPYTPGRAHSLFRPGNHHRNRHAPRRLDTLRRWGSRHRPPGRSRSHRSSPSQPDSKRPRSRFRHSIRRRNTSHLRNPHRRNNVPRWGRHRSRQLPPGRSRTHRSIPSRPDSKHPSSKSRHSIRRGNTSRLRNPHRRNNALQWGRYRNRQRRLGRSRVHRSTPSQPGSKRQHNTVHRSIRCCNTPRPSNRTVRRSTRQDALPSRFARQLALR